MGQSGQKQRARVRGRGASQTKQTVPLQKGGKGSRRWAIVLGGFALMFLAGAVYLLLTWRAAADSASRYRVAPECGRSEAVDCRQEGWVVVEDTHSTGGKNPRWVFTVRLADGSVVDLVDEENSGLYREFGAGAEARAVFWEGKVVEMRGAGSKRMVTQNNPDWQARDNLLAFALSLVAAPIFGYMSFLAYRGQLSRRAR